MKIVQMRSLMFDLYHGNIQKRIISHIKLLCAGKEMFEDMFEERIETVVNKNSPGSVVTKQLKYIYSRSEKPFYLSKHITVETMSNVTFNSNTLASGRMLLSHCAYSLSTYSISTLHM